MKSNPTYQRSFGVVILAVLFLLFGGNLFAGRAESLQGEKAVEKLKANGGYDSLAEAVRQARLADRQAEELQSRFNQQTKLTASDGAAGDFLGFSVAIAGNTAVVGAYKAKIGANTQQGAVYVFVRNSANVWTFQQKLTASDGGTNDYFGLSVAVADIPTPAQTTIMVGAYGNDANGQANRGAVYTFTRASGSTTWTFQQKLTASDGVANDTFGFSVAMTGNFVIIGAHNADTPGRVDVGAAYIFVRSGTAWSEEQKLTTPGGGTDNRHFGFSVTISGTLAAVGSNVTDSQQGWVYIFERIANGNTWLSQMGFQAGGKYGYSVALSGETLIVGSPEATIGTNTVQGMVNFYARVGGTWTDQGNFTASDGTAGDTFGTSVSISGNTAIVGADFDDNGTIFNQGSAYIFSRSATSWSEQQHLLASDGTGGEYFGIGVAINGTTIIVGALSNVGGITQQGAAYIYTLANSAPFDFDGDGKSDVSVFRPSNGAWYLQQSTAGFTGLVFGQAGDKIAPADYDGDGKTDVAVFRNGTWYLQRSTLGFTGVGFGAATDSPMPADFDGDGKADLAVFRPSTGAWYIYNLATNQTSSFAFGTSGDIPVAADYDGDGKTDIAVFRPSSGTWYLQRSSLGFTGIAFGQSGDKVVPADYDGDGKTDVAVFRPSSGAWYLQRSSLGFTGIAFGASTDIPAPADYDGDGKSDVAVFRPSSGTWYLQRSSLGFTGIAFGSGTDLAVPAAYIP